MKRKNNTINAHSYENSIFEVCCSCAMCTREMQEKLKKMNTHAKHSMKKTKKK